MITKKVIKLYQTGKSVRRRLLYLKALERRDQAFKARLMIKRNRNCKHSLVREMIKKKISDVDEPLKSQFNTQCEFTDFRYVINLWFQINFFNF